MIGMCASAVANGPANSRSLSHAALAWRYLPCTRKMFDVSIQAWMSLGSLASSCRKSASARS
jgi:hypothetical protein